MVTTARMLRRTGTIRGTSRAYGFTVGFTDRSTLMVAIVSTPYMGNFGVYGNDGTKINLDLYGDDGTKI